MTEVRLRALIAVADTGSVRAAALDLHVSESAVSAAVTLLSREVGVPMVERAGRGIRLTDAGRVYVAHAREILGLLDRAAAAARGETDPERGELRIAAVTTAGEQVLPVALADFRARHPGVELALEVAPSAKVWALMRAHQVDVVIAGRPPDDVPSRRVATLANELVVVAAPGVSAGFSWSETAWLSREPGSGTRDAMDAYLRASEASPPVLSLGSHGAVVAGAVAGLGATLVSRDSVADYLVQGRLEVLELVGTPMLRPWHLVVSERPSATTRLFVEHVLERPAAGSTPWRRATGGSPSVSSLRGTRKSAVGP